MSELEDPPQQTKIEGAIAIVGSAANFVPLAGTAREVLEAVFGSPLAKRQQDWFEKVAEAIRELQRRHVPLDSPQFVSAVVHATRIAQGTHLDEKLEMLKAAIIHSALPDRPGDIVTLRFLRFVDELDPEHFVVLSYLRDPAGHYDRNGIEKPDLYAGSPRALLDQARLPVGAETLALVVADLGERRLADAGALNAVMTGQGAWAPRSTALGNQLLDFVTYIEPPSDE